MIRDEEHDGTIMRQFTDEKKKVSITSNISNSSPVLEHCRFTFLLKLYRQTLSIVSVFAIGIVGVPHCEALRQTNVYIRLGNLIYELAFESEIYTDLTWYQNRTKLILLGWTSSSGFDPWYS